MFLVLVEERTFLKKHQLVTNKMCLCARTRRALKPRHMELDLLTGGGWGGMVLIMTMKTQRNATGSYAVPAADGTLAIRYSARSLPQVMSDLRGHVSKLMTQAAQHAEELATPLRTTISVITMRHPWPALILSGQVTEIVRHHPMSAKRYGLHVASGAIDSATAEAHGYDPTPPANSGTIVGMIRCGKSRYCSSIGAYVVDVTHVATLDRPIPALGQARIWRYVVREDQLPEFVQGKSS